MAAPADITAAVDAVETQAAPELAWSLADDDELDLPRSWRPTVRIALGVFAACVAIAGGITAIDQHWFSDLRTSAPASVAAPSSAAPPAEVTAHPEAAWTLPPVPPAEHLVSMPDPLPQAALSADDLAFLARMRSSGWVVTDPQQMVSVAHQACFELKRGASRQYVLANLFATDPAIGASGAVSFYSNMVAAYDCT
ncbi:DUF732 domain-containing protein [Mycobacterium paragordonae]|uniref:DUF732 domain-containing protein n=1 Tax=Mycobacterium paragordonae TaxID=1389713 RepID=UPI001061A5BE|nr:DUF732 domain-containing protein [Mycobacterium paragordonae]TDK88801.1 DUF732 domain-containing protein [Mycobacterium paragordonae]TDK95983.1 DUF732 domain-containing protein [Mycobacterium paragordonae]